MQADADAIADCVLATFQKLPEKRKPRPRNDGSREWVPLAGIVLSKEDGKLSCVSLGTGMKCLPSNKLPLVHGNVLHDWHAEVLAIRAFNRFLLDQCLLTCTPPYPTSDWIYQQSSDGCSEHPFAIREDVQIHMYCSEAPCGDASMELVMDAQEDATPWTSAPSTVSTSTNPEAKDTISTLRGRSNFSLLGVVRCKPSRSDAPPTLSKSCTDKLTLKQATSLLSSTSSLLLSPTNAYLHSLTIPSSQYIPEACTRAFSRKGRIHLSDSTISHWQAGYTWTPFCVRPTTREFPWSRRSIGVHEKAVASNLSAVWTPSCQETLIGGVLQGRKQFDPRGASAICRRRMWKLAAQIMGILGIPVFEGLSNPRYQDMKHSEVLRHREQVKQDMKNSGLNAWSKNTGDEAFTLPDV